MRKFIITSVIFFMALITATAGGGKSFVSLRTGFSLALGEYSQNDLENGCFTTNGMSFGAEGAWFFLKNLGVGLDINYSLHSVDAVGLATEKVRVDPFVLDMTVRSEPYSILTIMTGFYYSFGLTEKLIVQPKLMGGIMFGRTPFQLFEPTLLFPGPDYYKVTSSSDHGFAFKTGLLIKYDLSKCIAIGINADYTYSHLIFGFKTAGGNHEDRERNISYLDLGLGLIINL